MQKELLFIFKSNIPRLTRTLGNKIINMDRIRFIKFAALLPFVLVASVCINKITNDQIISKNEAIPRIIVRTTKPIISDLKRNDQI